MEKKVAAGLLLLALGAVSRLSASGLPPTLDLSGEWQVRGASVGGRVRLPGTLTDAGLGERQTDDVCRRYRAEPQKSSPALRSLYIGTAVYSRRFDLPPELAGMPLEVVLERVTWTSRVRVDGRDCGFRDSLGAAHIHRLPALSAGPHELEVEIDNAPRYGIWPTAHGYGHRMQGLWHGVVGRLEIRAASPLRDVRIFAGYPAGGRLRFEVPAAFAPTLENVRVDGLDIRSLSAAPSPYAAGRTLVTAELAAEPEAWSAFHPRLYTLELKDGVTSYRHRFGFRTIERKGGSLFLNGAPLFVRGDVENCSFPLTGCPAMTKREWKRLIRLTKLSGMNAFQFHTWTPPAAAFEAAEEEGFYLFGELAYWDATAGHGQREMDAFLVRELRTVDDAYGNSPAYLAVSFGNELGGCGFDALNGWMEAEKRYDPRRLTMCSTARNVVPSDDYMVTHRYPGVGMVRTRWNAHGGTDWDYEDVYSKCAVPTIAHEIGQWPVYPLWDVDLPKFTGPLVPWRWSFYRERAVSNGVMRFARRFHSASLKSSRHWYKAEAESYLRTPSCSGIEFLGLRDYMAQGEALVGWLDAFGDAKAGTSELEPFSNVMRDVPQLARFAKYVWTEGETLNVRFEVRNLTEQALPKGIAWPWSFGSRRGWMTLPEDVSPGRLATVGTLALPLVAGTDTGRRELRFGENAWTLYVLPKSTGACETEDFLETSDYAAAAARLASGGRVLFTGAGCRSGQGLYFEQTMDLSKGGFRPVYWSTVLFPMFHNRFNTLGASIDSDHPSLAGFPTDDWQDELWRDPSDHVTVHRLVGLPPTFEPIVLLVPDLHESTVLSPLFELAVGEGRLLVCGYDLTRSTPEGRLLAASLRSYVASAAFAPKTAVGLDWFRSSFDPGIPKESDALSESGDASFLNH